MKEYKSARTLGLIGSAVCLFYQVLPINLFVVLILNLFGLTLIAVSIFNLAKIFNDMSIFKKLLISIVMNLSAKAVIVKMSVGLLKKYENFLKFKGTSFHLSKEFVSTFMITYLVLVISAYIWQGVFYKLSQHTQITHFKIGGFLYFVGLAILITTLFIPTLLFVFLSKFLIIGSWILILIGFHKLNGSVV
ncbi:MAG: DUF996 domain-containing protein [Thermodesulfobacteria bacterium]|nr:DUF996 domain-containing protein [Thermodesulfobacteriota bacterium]